MTIQALFSTKIKKKSI